MYRDMPLAIRALILIGGLAIAGVIAYGVIQPAYLSTGKRMKPEVAAGWSLRILGAVLTDYQARHGEYPASLAALTTSTSEDGGPYYDELPVDPWGSPFIYLVQQQGQFSLHSAGPDGRDGTDDDIWYRPRPARR